MTVSNTIVILPAQANKIALIAREVECAIKIEQSGTSNLAINTGSNTILYIDAFGNEITYMKKRRR